MIVPHPRLRSILAAVRSAGAAALLLGPPSSLPAQAAPPIERTTALADAERALDEGAPFRASRLIAPLLAAAKDPSPATVLLAARAAAAWEGYGAVERLLAGRSWLDAGDGEGRALLARARLERGEPALEDARRAAATARGEALGPRTLLLARAYDRADQLDSASALYLRAERYLPELGEWLRLRAAGVLADSAARARIFAGLTLQAVLPRVRWTEALARERSGDRPGAARLYRSLGATLASIRLRLPAAPGPAQQSIKQELLAVIAARNPADDLREAVALLDRHFPGLSAEEELAVARRSAGAIPARGVQGFARVAAARALQPADRLAYGAALQRLSRHREAAEQLGRVEAREHLAQARYLRARSLLAAGARAEALAGLEQLTAGSFGDSAISATAGYLRADLLIDEGRDGEARAAYRAVARRYPRTSHGARAALQAAVLAWVQGDRGAAAAEFAALAERASETSEGIAALYWHGRVLHAAGDSVAATLRWRSIQQRFPGSYYAVPAAARLGVPALAAAPPALARAGGDSAARAALVRGRLLERMGLRVEARFEYEHLMRQAESDPGQLLPIARLFLEAGQIGRAYRLSARTGETAAQWLAFPLPPDPVREAAVEAGVDPLLAAALIRQESGFEPGARSVADARGLMQVLPSVGAGMAPAAGLLDWDPALLYQPEVNAYFGMTALARTLSRHGELPVALAAYNAGDRPATRWRNLPGADDPDVFIERIQYLETRDYVRRVLRGLAVYRTMHGDREQ